MTAQPRDTIAAISTALGPGAIAVVRLSGDAAIEIADAVFSGATLSLCASHTVHYGHVMDRDGRHADEVLATVLRAPHSYTTDHMVEFSCHGGPMAARHVLEVILAAGARPARRGEFTERAFLAGRLDLVQAEAVADVVGARTRRGLEIALGQLGGSLSRDLAELRDAILDFRADVEAAIDFADQDIEPPAGTAVASGGTAAIGLIDALLEHSDVGLAVRDGVSAAIVGRPNVGKSSLMNALLMRDRSIVTPLPGTTRDVIEECLHLSGVAVRLIDTAGWRDAENEAEAAGVGRARAAAAGADVVLLVVEANAPATDSDREIAAELDLSRTLLVANKVDLGDAIDERDAVAIPSGGAAVPCVRVSSLTGAGLGDLREAIIARALGEASGEPVRVWNARHVASLRRCRDALVRAVALVEACAPPELSAVEIADAGAALGEVTGETTPDDVLRRIFDRFCVGK